MSRARDLANHADGNITATSFSGDGAGLTGVAKLTAATSAPSTPAAGDQWFDTTSGIAAMKVWSGTEWNQMSNGFSATGGTESVVSGYKYHTFTSSGTFNVIFGSYPAQCLIVAGGGSGGGSVTYTEFDLTPNATSVTFTLSADPDVHKIEFRIAYTATSSGPNNETFTVKTSTGTSHQWDINAFTVNTGNTVTVFGGLNGVDLWSFLTSYAQPVEPLTFTFTKMFTGEWVVESIIPRSASTTPQTTVLQARTDFGDLYADIGSFVMSTGSAYNFIIVQGTIVEYYK